MSLSCPLPRPQKTPLQAHTIRASQGTFKALTHPGGNHNTCQCWTLLDLQPALVTLPRPQRATSTLKLCIYEGISTPLPRGGA